MNMQWFEDYMDQEQAEELSLIWHCVQHRYCASKDLFLCCTVQCNTILMGASPVNFLYRLVDSGMLTVWKRTDSYEEN